MPCVVGKIKPSCTICIHNEPFIYVTCKRHNRGSFGDGKMPFPTKKDFGPINVVMAYEREKKTTKLLS
jgi:hypothetical protein